MKCPVFKDVQRGGILILSLYWYINFCMWVTTAFYFTLYLHESVNVTGGEVNKETFIISVRDKLSDTYSCLSVRGNMKRKY